MKKNVQIEVGSVPYTSQEQTRICYDYAAQSPNWKKPLPLLKNKTKQNCGYISITIKENVIWHVSIVETGVYTAH